MSSVNAPQPNATGPAEVFDSVAPTSDGNVSSIGLPGPTPQEVPMHAGELNGIDPYISQQFIAFGSFTWTTGMDPGTLLFQIPVHPTYVHQFIAHLSKMYNAWGGGFDICLKIAGTGFHAGALLMVRLPPNIRPNSLRTVADITAFEYTVMDPKTLEVVTKTLMDQRNIMYHYMPFDENNIQSFGGYFAVYVMLPLNTSSTGATQITLQVLARPSQQFVFAQLRPIRDLPNPSVVPTEIEQALDFKKFHCDPIQNQTLDTMTVHARKDKPLYTVEHINTIDFDGKPVGGPLFDPIPVNKNLLPSDFPNRVGNIIVTLNGTNDRRLKTDDKIRFDHFQFDSKAKPLPMILESFCFITFYTPDAEKDRVTIECEIGYEQGRQFLKPRRDNDYYIWQYDTHVLPTFATDQLGILDTKNWNVQFGLINLNDRPTPLGPPIEESLIDFQVFGRSTTQTELMKELLKDGKMSQVLTTGQSAIFELYDAEVELPILPIKLHRKGYLTSISVKENRVFNLWDKKYEMRFISRVPETTPLVGAMPRPLAEYKRNIFMSARMAS